MTGDKGKSNTLNKTRNSKTKTEIKTKLDIKNKLKTVEMKIYSHKTFKNQWMKTKGKLMKEKISLRDSLKIQHEELRNKKYERQSETWETDWELPTFY